MDSGGQLCILEGVARGLSQARELQAQPLNGMIYDNDSVRLLHTVCRKSG